MGKPSDSLQNMQLFEGGPHPRRGRYAHKIERALMNYLKDNYRGSIGSDWELEAAGIDSKIFNLIFKDWKKIEVDFDSVRVEF